MVRHRSGRTYRNRNKRIDKPASCGHEAWIINLLRWMHEFQYRGTQCLVPANFKDTGRGLQTKTRIHPGDTIVSLPAGILITTNTVLSSEIGEFIKTWRPKLTPQQCISVFLIWETQKGPLSTWKPYLDSLPQTFNTPAYFTDRELDYLPKSLRTKARKESQKVRQKFLDIQTHAKHHWECLYDVLDWAVFRWAWYVINTRSVYLKQDQSFYLSQTEEEDNIALAPFLDLLNHSPDAKITAGFDPSSNSYKIVTHDAYKPFDQVFISYGCHGNGHLAIEYGFCVPDNSQDEVQFNYDGIIAACKQFGCLLIDEKIELLRENNMLKTLSCNSEGLTWNFWLAMKTLAMEYHHLKKWTKIFSEPDAFHVVEVKAKSIAQFILQGYLRETLETTANISMNIARVARNDHIKLCVSLLTEEKKMLEASLHNLDSSNF